MKVRRLPIPLASAVRWLMAVLAWLIVMAVGSSTAVALNPYGLGSSGTAPVTAENARIGALFTGGISNGHFCTASVVDSPGGDVIITAAHCLSGGAGSTVFVPGYRDGDAPYGVWPVEHVVESVNWTSEEDPDYDVAFAVLAPLHGREIESVVGANVLGIDMNPTQQITLTGYPETSNLPLTCSNYIGLFSSTQLSITCAAYTDGTSGSPWVVPGRLGKDHDEGTVMGVIGGFEQGGYTPDVSYSVYFDDSVGDLYQQAVTLVR
jgi:hypothetical protein